MVAERSTRYLYFCAGRFGQVGSTRLISGKANERRGAQTDQNGPPFDNFCAFLENEDFQASGRVPPPAPIETGLASKDGPTFSLYDAFFRTEQFLLLPVELYANVKRHSVFLANFGPEGEIRTEVEGGVLFNLHGKESEYLSSDKRTLQGVKLSLLPAKIRRRGPTEKGSIPGWKRGRCGKWGAHLVRGKPRQRGKPSTYRILSCIFLKAYDGASRKCKPFVPGFLRSGAIKPRSWKSAFFETRKGAILVTF